MFASVKSFYKSAAIIIHLYFITCLIKSAVADCSIHVSNDENSRPILYKYVGSHRLKISANTATHLIINENQKIEANCDLHFKTPIAFEQSIKLYIKCDGGYLYANTDFDVNNNNQYIGSGPTLECYYPQLGLYESNRNFEWCAANATSYDVATVNVWSPNKSPYIVSAGICFDIYTNSFNSIYYTLGPYKLERSQPHIFDDSYIVGFEIEYIKETFGSNSILATVFEDNKFAIWVNDYHFSSIIQHWKLDTMFNEMFATLLEFMWWPNLRLNNWSHYTKALESHIENDKQSYDILAGVSGAVKVPILQRCQKKFALEEVIYNTNRRIPQYVWNYLQDRSNNSNQIVIIGLNSPIPELSLQNDMIFCPDKCQEIPWLKEASSSFRFSMMGIIFCCSVEDVRQSRRLNGFPETDFLPEPTVSSELPNEVEEDTTTNNNYWDN